MRIDVNAVRPARLRYAILERCAAQLGRAHRKSAGSVGVGIGRRQRGGRVEPEWCVKFYVPKKAKRPRQQEPLPKFMPSSLKTTDFAFVAGSEIQSAS